MDGYRVFGIWYCKQCKCRQRFISFDVKISDPDFAECIVCGYRYGKCIDYTATNPGDRIKPVLDRKVVAAGLRESMELDRKRMERDGVPLKVPNEIRRELHRRLESEPW